ncbi:hypothetical protein Tco_0046265 [Tanacetum coccineum]
MVATTSHTDGRLLKKTSSLHLQWTTVASSSAIVLGQTLRGDAENSVVWFPLGAYDPNSMVISESDIPCPSSWTLGHIHLS